jgi:uncharacterized membrane protein YedE/YeeE
VATVLAALASGLLFGLGLTISQMINPAKVIGFLDLVGDWEPSLAFVMLTAIPAAAVGYTLARRWRAPLCSAEFSRPAQTRVDRNLIVGAVLFGAGWGIVGYCPGSAIAGLGFGSPATVLFVGSMLGGMGSYRALQSVVSNRAKHA